LKTSQGIIWKYHHGDFEILSEMTFQEEQTLFCHISIKENLFVVAKRVFLDTLLLRIFEEEENMRVASLSQLWLVFDGFSALRK